MTTSCPHCSAQLYAQWTFCPYCGTASTHQAAQAPVEAEREKAPSGSAFGGLFFGFIAAPVCIIVGIMLCLTGLGVFAGVPLIVVGLCAPLIGSLLGMNELKGKCPYCGAAINSIVNHKDGFFCHACSRKIEVRDHVLVKAA